MVMDLNLVEPIRILGVLMEVDLETINICV